MKLRRSRFVTSVLSFALVLVPTLSSPLLSNPATTFATPEPPSAGNHFANPSPPGQKHRVQFAPRVSSSHAVWMENSVPNDPTKDPLNEEDIVGIDVGTDQSIVVSDKPGNQSNPAIAGSIVVWQEAKPEHPNGEGDIVGKDLRTGAEITIATGPNDQAFPVIDGTTVAWVEGVVANGLFQQKEIHIQDIATAPSKEGAATGRILATVAPAVPLGHPKVSAEYVVWTQGRKETANSAATVEVWAYNRRMASTRLVFTSEEIGADYELSDHRLVWTGSSSLQITDLSSGQTSLLYDGRALAPSISGDTILWNVRSDDNNGEDVWGLKLNDRHPLPLVTGEGSKSYPVVADDHLFVRRSDKSTEGKVEKTSLSQTFATAPEREKLHKEFIEKSKQKQSVSQDKSSSSASNAGNVAAAPTLQNQLKGIYAPRDNFGGNNAWQLGNRPSGLDALVQNRTDSYFGTITVQYEQLWSGRGPASLYDDPVHNIYAYGGPYNTSTGIYNDARWGPEVRYAMRTLQNAGVRVIVKINPPRNEDKQPNANGSYTPNMFAYNHVRWSSKNWTQHMQIGNEPNLEWQDSCGNCWWWDNAHMFTWEDKTDARFYKAINAWYTNVYYQILAIRDNPNEDPSIRSQLTNTTFWSPPMLSVYGDNVFDGYRWDGTRNCCYNYYEYLQQMIRSYRRFSYHIYPNPKDDSYNGYILHNQWFRFPGWLQSWISTYSVNYGPDFYSQITEFGWDGPTMRACRYTQNDVWAAYSDRCNTRDGYNHTFEGDISGFLQNERHNALAVTVWITSGWKDDCNGNCGTDRAGGIDESTGNLKRWLYTYQQQYYP